MPNRMSSRIASVTFCTAMSLAAPSSAQNFSPAASTMFRETQQQPNDLARYMYLLKETPKLPKADQQLGLQMFASVENELGLYNEALFDFPLKSHIPADASLPTPTDWTSTDAVDAITSMARDRRLVMVNEAHHDAHTRLLTLALLPRLRALGFDYLAIEALSDKDTQLMQRGYAIEDSGTQYLHEPTYGEIVRTAIRLGYTLVPYDVDASSQTDRESRQADNLYRRTFARDPHAKVLVHAGYAHIDKARGRLGNTQPMAARLQQLSGIEPLSIDQTRFREQIPSEDDAYRQLVRAFPSSGPIVLISRTTGKPWSDNPDAYDMNVLLPAGTHRFGERGLHRPTSNVHSSDRDHLMLPDPIVRLRPDWLAQESDRAPYPIRSSLCKVTFPCVIDAHVFDEPDTAVAADRYAFMQGDVVSKLYLRPGRYRLRAWGLNGQTLTTQTITVERH
ncbi:Haem-binding uptake Tiki superfamily ChaN domain-containing protein [Rhodanobacter sp. Root179]|uniref:hypothetical protein n=1 Tax=Rhodanobacter sp. Root179 TaxID=1736482 RepID=UPI0009E79A94|nr:hypothetical protein [Rhodanobacter sp. Root179]